MKVKLNGNDFYEVTSKYGVLDNVHSTPHTGIDLAMDIGTKLYSPVDGVITKVVDYGSNNIGKGIFIETDNHQTVIMGHLSHASVSVGERVGQGDFVALSGSTGRSTGGHLHLGLKDANGNIINPVNLTEQPAQEVGFMDNVTGWWDFLQRWRHEGFWNAMYGKPFFEVIKDFLGELAHDIGVFILGNGDLIFLLPAVTAMLGTWLVGRNKYTKFILPLFLGYFITRVFYYKIL